MRSFLLLAVALVCLAPRGFAQAALRVGDVFELRLSGMPAEAASEFGLQYTVSESGEVDLPYIHKVKAQGLTAAQLATTIQQRLIDGKIFTTPAAVISLQPQSRFVTIGGGVKQPQTVAWSPDLTLWNAVWRAGGPGDFADMRKVKVRRDGKSNFYNLKRVDADPRQNPKLLPGDEVEVKESTW